MTMRTSRKAENAPQAVIAMRHPAFSTMKPRVSWPSAAPVMPATSVSAASMGKIRAGNHCAARASAQTTVGAAPSPIRIRVASAAEAVFDIAKRNEATVHRDAPVMSTERTPKRETRIPAGTCRRM